MDLEDISTHAKTETDHSEGHDYSMTVSQSEEFQNLFLTGLVTNVGSQIQSTEYLTDDMFIGVGCNDGAVRVLSALKGNVQYVLRNIDHSPVSCLALNPNSSNIKNSLISTHTDGTLEYWHATSQQLLFSKKYEQILHCCEISSDGHYYVFAGDKGHLKMGALTKGNPLDLDQGSMGAHTNRVFCLKWNPYDANVFFSGGWDKTVFAWDIRSKTAVSKIFGIYMGGSAIDINKDNQLLLGNNTNEMPLRVYDLKAGKARLIDWRPLKEEEFHYTTGVLACFFGYVFRLSIIAASPNRDVRHFKNGKCVSRYENQNLEKKIFSLSKSQSQRSCCIGWNNGQLQILKY